MWFIFSLVFVCFSLLFFSKLFQWLVKADREVRSKKEVNEGSRSWCLTELENCVHGNKKRSKTWDSPFLLCWMTWWEIISVVISEDKYFVVATPRHEVPGNQHQTSSKWWHILKGNTCHFPNRCVLACSFATSIPKLLVCRFILHL